MTHHDVHDRTVMESMMSTHARTRSRFTMRCAALLVTALLAIPGCSGLSQPYQPTTQFGLVASDDSFASASPSTRQGTIRVSRLRVHPPASSRHFLYRMDEVTYRSDYHNEFVAPPERLLTAALIEGLIARGPFQTVVEPGGTADATLRLETTVTDLHGDFRDLSAPTAVIRARVILLEDGPATTRHVAEWTLEQREPIPSPAAADLAQGYSRAWAQIVDELATALRPFAR